MKSYRIVIQNINLGFLACSKLTWPSINKDQKYSVEKYRETPKT